MSAAAAQVLTVTAQVAAATSIPPAAPIVKRPRRRPRLLGGFFWLLIGLLYLPIAILFIFSINDGTSLSPPLKGFSSSGTRSLRPGPCCAQ